MECVIVEDASTPDKAITEEFPGVRLLRGEGLGVGGARNMGLDAARGEFVIFLDDDDVAMPGRISTLVTAARQSGADLCYGMTRRVVVDGDFVLPDVPTDQLEPGQVGFCDLLTCTPHVNAVLTRTAALRDVGGVDAAVEHFDDWSAWLRLADRNVRMWRVADVVAEWRVHALGLSGLVTRARTMEARLLALFERLSAELSSESVNALALARECVLAAGIVTYDDYANAMVPVRDRMHAEGRCLGRRVLSHGG